MKRIKIIPSHAGLARYLAECKGDEDGGVPIGYLPRQRHIPSPYAYSPVHSVYEHGGRPVIIVETAHKRYEVFTIGEDTRFYKDAEDAETVALAR